MAEVPRLYSSTGDTVYKPAPKTKLRIRKLQPMPAMENRASFTSFFERMTDMTVAAVSGPKHGNPDNTLRSLITQEKELEGEHKELEQKHTEAVEKSDVSYAAYLKAGRGSSQQAARVFNAAWKLKEELRRQIVRHEAILEGVRADIVTLRKDGE